MEIPNVISLRNVTKVFRSENREFTALQNISLDIRGGEYTAIVGKSGSGKSTLLNMITGIDRPSSGEIFYQNTPIQTLTENQLARWRGQNVGIVFQFFQLIPTLTVQENVLLAMEFVGQIPKVARQSRAKMLLEQVGIDSQAHKLPAMLSGGQQQRAAIARALANAPALLVADEPTGNLDSQTAADINRLFEQLTRNGTTVLVVTHEKEAATRYARTITIADGHISQETTNSLHYSPVILHE